MKGPGLGYQDGEPFRRNSSERTSTRPERTSTGPAATGTLASTPPRPWWRGFTTYRSRPSAASVLIQGPPNRDRHEGSTARRRHHLHAALPWAL